MSTKQNWLRALLLARPLSPQGLIVRAAAIAAVFLVLHLCGLREYTTLLTGTSPAGGAVDKRSLALGMLYVMAHLGTVTIAPVIALAGLGWAGWNFWRRRKAEGLPAEASAKAGGRMSDDGD